MKPAWLLGYLICMCCLPGLTQPALTLGFLLQQSPTCGTNNGSIQLQPTGGVAPYQYSLDGVNFGANATYTGLAAGIYTAWVVDANQDTAIRPLALSNPSGPGVLINAVTPVLCANGNDGVVDVSGFGGAGTPYLFSLNGGPFQGNGIFTGLAAGTYFVELRDAAECRRYQVLTITEPTPVVASLSGQTTVDCFGGNNAFITLSATGGQAGGFQYSLDGITFQSSGTFAGLGAGIYTPMVEDTDGCRDTLSLLIAQPPELQLTVDSLLELACFGDSLGQLQATATGGTSPYSFALDGVNFGTANSFDSLPAGVYPLTVQDANGCLDQEVVALSEPPALQLALVGSQDPFCAGDSTGFLSLTASGGTTPYQVLSPIGQWTGSVVQGLPSGTVPLTLLDTNGCVLRDTFELTDPAPLGIQLGGDAPSCAELADGQVFATVVGGSGPLTLMWNADPSSSADTLINVLAGHYHLLVVDSLGCQDSAHYELIGPDSMRLTAQAVADSCSMQQGMISLQASGGDGSYLFSLDGVGLPGTNQDHLPGGIYEAVVSDGQGCADTLAVPLGDQPPPVLVLDSVGMISCAGETDGRLSVVASGGTGAYVYLWPDLGLSSPSVSGLGEGNYQVVVFDGVCHDTLLTNLVAPDSLYIQVDSLRPPACNSDPTGFISLSGIGGQMPYSFDWSHADTLDAPMASGLGGGMYTIVLTDAAGCQDQVELSLSNPLALETELAVLDIRCPGEENGAIAALVGGGIPPYSYQWSNGSNSPRIENLSEGTYILVVEDQSGCRLLDTAMIQDPLPLQVAVDVTPASCADRDDGIALATATGGTAPYQYYWSNGLLGNLIIRVLPDSYVLQLRDQRNCIKDTLIIVPSPDPLSLTLQELNPSTCTEPNGSITVGASGGTAPYAYEWDSPVPQSGPTAINLTGDVPDRPYMVQVRDSMGCVLSQEIPLPDRPSPHADVLPYFEPDGTMLLSEASLYAENRTLDAAAFRWLVNDSTVGIGGDLSYRAIRPGPYHIQLVAYDEYFACPDTVSFRVEVVADGRLWVPTAFTPNGDGRNDLLRIQGEGVVSFDMVIYNQWGREVRRINSLEDSWDGRSSSGRVAPEGAYAYRLSVQLNNGLQLDKRGSINLIR